MAPSQSTTSTESLLQCMTKSLPQRENNQPILRDQFAAIALFSHSYMLTVGFRLVGLGEDHEIEVQSDPRDTRPLPSHWDATSTYAFRYRHSQSSMEYLVKVTRLGGKALIYGVAVEDDKTAQFEIKAQDYISEGSLKNMTDVTPSSLKDAFISPGRISDLSSLFEINIVRKLAPGLQKEGVETASSTTRSEQSSRDGTRRSPAQGASRDDRPEPARPHPMNDPLALPPRRPGPVPDFAPPDFENEFEIGRQPRGYPGFGGQPFGNIGEQDLYPQGLGPHDPLRIGPGRGGMRGGGGMHPTFDDPLFRGQRDGNYYDTRAPPGARYDPVGPGDGPPQAGAGRYPGGGSRGSGGGFGRPPNPFGGFGGGDFI